MIGRKEVERHWLRQEIDRGLRSGEAAPASPAFWDGLRQKLKNSPPVPGDNARPNSQDDSGHRSHRKAMEEYRKGHWPHGRKKDNATKGSGR